jgi:uncharacterized membrane protein
MGTVITIIFVVAIIGALIGYFGSGGKKEGAVVGAATGALFAGNLLVQLLILGLGVFAGLWLVGKVFF